jgi:hypothetical protein
MAAYHGLGKPMRVATGNEGGWDGAKFRALKKNKIWVNRMFKIFAPCWMEQKNVRIDFFLAPIFEELFCRWGCCHHLQ